jgi:hypothetical protein
MKVLSEIIDYLISHDKLDEFAMRFLEEQGFYNRWSQVDDIYYDEVEQLAKALQQLEEDEEERNLTLEIQAIAHELLQSKKGKGRRSRPRKKRISLRELNAEILSHIDEWTSELAPLFSLTGLPPAEVAARLKFDFVEDMPSLAQKTEQVLKYQPRLLGPISKSLFYTDHQQLLLKKMKQLPLRQRLRLRQWLFDKNAKTTLQGQGFTFLRHCLDLQETVLWQWVSAHPSLQGQEDYYGKTYSDFCSEYRPIGEILLALGNARDRSNGQPAEWLSLYLYLISMCGTDGVPVYLAFERRITETA